MMYFTTKGVKGVGVGKEKKKTPMTNFILTFQHILYICKV